MGHRIVFLLCLLNMNSIGIAATRPARAHQRKNAVLFLVTDSWAEDDAAAVTIGDAVASRIEQWNVSVRQVAWTKRDIGNSRFEQDAAAVCARSDAMGCFWISRQETIDACYRVHLLFFSGKNEWSHTREVDTDEISILAETTAMVVKSTLKGILTQPISQTPENSVRTPWSIEDDEPIPASQHVPEPSRPPLPLLISGGYSIALMGEDIDASQGIGGEIAIVGSKNISIFAGYAGNWLSSLEDDQMFLRVRLHPVHVGGRYTFYRGCLALAVGAAVGFIPTEYKIAGKFRRSLFSGYQERTTFQWSIAPGVRGSLRLAPWLCVFLGVSLDVLLVRPIYTVTYANGKRTLLKPWQVMPGFQLGMAFGRTGFETGRVTGRVK